MPEENNWKLITPCISEPLLCRVRFGIGQCSRAVYLPYVLLLLLLDGLVLKIDGYNTDSAALS